VNQVVEAERVVFRAWRKLQPPVTRLAGHMQRVASLCALQRPVSACAAGAPAT
jgi:hypothetical protein